MASKNFVNRFYFWEVDKVIFKNITDFSFSIFPSIIQLEATPNSSTHRRLENHQVSFSLCHFDFDFVPMTGRLLQHILLKYKTKRNNDE